MKKLHQIKSGFTLIEIIVASTIFSIIMISVIFIFANSSEISSKIDINRSIQENVKNIVETIAEDIKNNGIKICQSGITQGCVDNTVKFSLSNDIWIGDNHYYLAKKDLISGNYIKVSNVDCLDLIDMCYIVRNGDILSNSSVRIKSLNFTIFSEFIHKVQINFVISPMTKMGVRADTIKNNELIYQTTISEKYIKQ